MADPRVEKFARILVDYSTRVGPGDRVAITSTTAAEPLVRELYALVLERGGHPHLLFDLPGQDELLYAHASDEQLDFVPQFHKMAFEQFEVLIKIRSELNTRALSAVEPARQSRRQKAVSTLLHSQLKRGAEKSLRWMSTLYPTSAYAMEAEMGLEAYEDFVFRAMHADEGTADPVAYWQNVEHKQRRIVERIQGHDRVELRGPNVDLSLSIKGRLFRNASGQQNLPDGEIYTGPVEDSAQGWVRYTYPAIYQGREVEGVELKFEDGKVVQATAKKNQAFLFEMLGSDAGARYIGEFAIGTNFEIDRFTRNILFDEKIGGSFHMALGAGYPETGSKNKSVVHWDMICDLRQDSEILVDGEVVYRNGQFVF
ncbi:MAG TPA: aminopeptidase [Anaerolineales bacterium]|nr:aminopeptidase [Anaerolineales bacterium]